jgi:hypothetical protein
LLGKDNPQLADMLNESIEHGPYYALLPKLITLHGSSVSFLHIMQVADETERIKSDLEDKLSAALRAKLLVHAR